MSDVEEIVTTFSLIALFSFNFAENPLVIQLDPYWITLPSQIQNANHY